MICKTKNMKRIMALLLTTVMTVSVFDQMTFAASSDNSVTGESNYSQDDTQGKVLYEYPDGTTAYVETEDADTEYVLGTPGKALRTTADVKPVTGEQFEEIVNSDADDDNDLQVEQKVVADATYPASVDNSQSEFFPAIGNQSGIGSCVSWAVVYYGFTYANCRAKNIPATGDNVMSPAFVYNKIKTANGGTWETNAYSMLTQVGTTSKNHADFESYDFEQSCKTWFPEKELWQEAADNRLTSFTRIGQPDMITSPDDSDLNVIKEYLNNGYLINITARVRYCENGYIPSGSVHAGEWIRLSTGSEGYHEMTIVGYDDNIYYDINGNGTIEDAERGAFKVANSWGDDWCNDGFIWYAYDSLNGVSQAKQDGISRYPAMYDFYTEYVQPGGRASCGVQLVMDLATAKRNQDRIYIRATKKDGSKTYYDSFNPTSNYNVLQYALDGSQSMTDGTVIYDLDSIVSDITPANVNDYTWQVKVYDYDSDSNPLILKDAYIEADGNKVAQYNGEDVSVDGKENTVTLDSLVALNFGWDITGNESSLSAARKLTAKMSGISDTSNVTYKYEETFNGITKTLKDYSYSTEYTWRPSKTGNYTLTAYANIDGTIYSKSFNCKINNNPITTKLNYDKNNYYVNEAVNVTAEFADGTGNKSLQAVYVVGGNYPYTSKTLYFTITGNNTATWTPEMDGQYTVYVTTKDSVGGINLSNLGTITVNPARDVVVEEFTSTAKNGASIRSNTTLYVVASGGSGNYVYRYGNIKNGTEYYITDRYVDYASITIPISNLLPSEGNVGNPDVVGDNTLFVDVFDTVNNKTARKTLDLLNVEGLSVTSFTATTSTGNFTVGQTISLKTATKNEFTYRYNTYQYSYIFNGVEKNISAYGPSSGYSRSFTPQEPGKYTFKFYVRDNIGQEATKTVDVTVTSNQAVIYYDNSSWNNANIHYCVNNGTWTNVPGVAMEESDIEGYAWKYVIDLGEQSGATVCFNNGNNSWDSRNGSNYTVSAGTYGIKNGNINTITMTASMEFVGEVGSKSALVTISNGTAPYAIGYKVYKDGELQYSSTVTTSLNHAYLSFSMYYEGLYRVEATITDAQGNKCAVTGAFDFPGLIIDLVADKDSYKVGEQVNVTCTLTNLFYYKFYPATYWYVTKNGESVEYTQSGSTISFIPTQAGTYEVTFDIPNYSLGEASKTITINVTDGNTAVVYYNNSSWNNANIHYCVDNGTWTNVPGVKMQASDKAGYSWMYTIDLGEQSGATVCFNNGNNSWDSRNGSNYRVQSGVYAVSGGNVVKLS